MCNYSESPAGLLAEVVEVAVVSFILNCDDTIIDSTRPHPPCGLHGRVFQLAQQDITRDSSIGKQQIINE